MRIVLCVSSMAAGGAERVAATLASAWSVQGHTVVLMPTYSGRGECFYPLAPATHLVFLADLVRPQHGGPISTYWRRLRSLRRFLREFHPDVVVSFLPNVNIMVLAASRGFGLRTIVCERTDPFEMPVGRSLKLLRAMMYPLASRLVVQTEAVAQKFRELRRPVPPITVIGNPIPEEFMVRAPQPPRSPGAPRRLLAVGRLSEEKQFDRLILAFSKLAPRHPDWTLRIVGEGPERHRLEALGAELGIGTRLELPGRCAGIEGEFMVADAFALTSRFEGFPNALLEAMASGLACVATDCPSGPSEISEQGRSALLVPVDDLGALERALDQLMSSEPLRRELAELARQSVTERFSLGRILARWEGVLQP